MTSLSKSQRLAIAKALERHGIPIKKDELTSLFAFLEHAIEGHRRSESVIEETSKAKMTAVSRAQLYGEIERLRVSLEKLSLSSALILRITCARVTELTSILNKISKDDKELPITMVFVVMRAIENACESILSGRENYDPAWVASNGRPQSWHKQAFVGKLAMAFERWTGRKATDTESGPFDDFLSACLIACNLKEGAGTNRKLIRAALHNPTGHVMSLNLAKFSDVSGHS